MLRRGQLAVDPRPQFDQLPQLRRIRHHLLLRTGRKGETPAVKKAADQRIQNVETLGVALRAFAQQIVNVFVDSSRDYGAVIFWNVLFRVVVDRTGSQTVLARHRQRRDAFRQCEIYLPDFCVRADLASFALPAGFARHIVTWKKPGRRKMWINRRPGAE